MTARVVAAWAVVGIPLVYGLVETHQQGVVAVHQVTDVTHPVPGLTEQRGRAV